MSSIEHKEISLSFGGFDPQKTHLVFSNKKWQVSQQENEQKAVTTDITEEFDAMNMDQLQSVYEDQKIKIAEFVDLKDRLTVHTLVMQLCLAHGLQTYHHQVGAVLKESVSLKNVGPELMSIDRARLASSLGDYF